MNEVKAGKGFSQECSGISLSVTLSKYQLNSPNFRNLFIKGPILTGIQSVSEKSCVEIYIIGFMRVMILIQMNLMFC
jgi:hypothetical protein